MKIWEWLKDKYWDVRHWLYFGRWPTPPLKTYDMSVDFCTPVNVTEIEGIRLIGVHSPKACGGRVCIIHNPTDHHMRSWKLHWRDDRGIFERLCPTHGCGHPDPDQWPYWVETGREIEAIHGCCGCCFRAGAIKSYPYPELPPGDN